MESAEEVDQLEKFVVNDLWEDFFDDNFPQPQ